MCIQGKAKNVDLVSPGLRGAHKQLSSLQWILGAVPLRNIVLWKRDAASGRFNPALAGLIKPKSILKGPQAGIDHIRII